MKIEYKKITSSLCVFFFTLAVLLVPFSLSVLSADADVQGAENETTSYETTTTTAVSDTLTLAASVAETTPLETVPSETTTAETTTAETTTTETTTTETTTAETTTAETTTAETTTAETTTAETTTAETTTAETTRDWSVFLAEANGQETTLEELERPVGSFDPDTGKPYKYLIEIEFGSLQFYYDWGEWSPTTHDYVADSSSNMPANGTVEGEPGWYGFDGINNRITVINHSITDGSGVSSDVMVRISLDMTDDAGYDFPLSSDSVTMELYAEEALQTPIGNYSENNYLIRSLQGSETSYYISFRGTPLLENGEKYDALGEPKAIGFLTVTVSLPADVLLARESNNENVTFPNETTQKTETTTAETTTAETTTAETTTAETTTAETTTAETTTAETTTAETTTTETTTTETTMAETTTASVDPTVTNE